MSQIEPIRRRGRHGTLAFMFAAVLAGSLVLAVHSPLAPEGTKPAVGGAAPAPAGERHFDPNFVYFPSQYELHAGPPEEHIEAF